MNWKEQIRLASRIFAVSVFALFMASAIVFGLLQTNWGVKELARWASSPDIELTFSPHGVSGIFPIRFEMERLNIADTRGVWLEARGIKVHWSPLQLIKGRMSFKTLMATSLNFDRLPISEGETGASLPSWILAFRLDRFTIDRLTLGKELVGEAAILRLDARIPSAPQNQNLEASVKIERTDRVGSLFEASVTIQGETQFMRAEISLHEDRDGLLGKALGVEGPLSLSLSGEGTPELWQGKLLAGVLPFGRLAADLEVKDAKDRLIRLHGRFDPVIETMPPLARIWLDREVPFEIETRLLWPKALVVERAALQAHALDLTLGGTFDLNQHDLAGQFSLTCFDLKPLGEVVRLPTAGKMVSQGTFSTKKKILRFSVTGSAEDFQVRDLQKVLGKNISWEFRGEGSAVDTWSIDQMKLSADNLLLEGSGKISGPEAEAAMDASFEVKDLRPLSSLEFLAGWETQGSARVSWNITSRTLSSHFQGNLKPSARVKPPFLAKDIHYDGTLSLEHGEVLNVSRLEMVSPWGRIEVDGKALLPQESLEATWHLLLPVLDPFSSTLKGGPVEARGTVRGPVKGLTLSADASARGLAISGLYLDRGHASLQAQTGEVTQGNVKVDAQVKEMGWRGQTDFVLSNQRLDLKRISLEGGRSTMTGALSLFLNTGLADGELKAECKDLAALSPLFHEKIQGSAILEARLSSSENEQRASLTMDATSLISPFGEALRTKIEAQGTLSGTLPRGRATFEIQNGTIGNLTLASSALVLEGDLEKASFRLTAEGHYRDSIDLEGSGQATVSFAKEQVTLSRLEGRYGGTPFSLHRPFTLTRSAERIDLGECLLSLGSGQFQASGYAQSSALSLDLRFDGIPLQWIPVQEFQSWGGLARGTARLRGSPARPEGAATLQVESLRFHDQSLPAAGLTLHAALRDNRVETTFLVQGLSGTPLKGSLEYPMVFSLSPLGLTFPPREEWRGTLKGEFPLEKVAGLIQLHEQKLAGTVELDLGLEGSLEKPRVTGWIKLKNGSYENLRTGTILREIEVGMAAQTPMLVIDKATAIDGEKGRLSAHGRLEFATAQGFRFELELALEEVKPIRYDWGTAVVGADLTLKGSLSEALLAGRVRVDSAEFRIPERIAPEIQDVQVIEINKTGGTQGPVIENATPRPWPLSLNLTVTSPGRVFLRGRGLDSEWKGEIQVKGTAAQPVVTGSLSIVRGSANFLGKRFDLKSGSLFFSGSTPPSPRIDVVAEAKSKDITARLQFTGPVRSLEVKLSSDPPLPPDEILSRLLFGRSASNITPLQAVQLADSINTLAGGGGFDVLGRTRQLLSLDQLTLDQTGKNQDKTALSVGKYLSENVYIEVHQGISPETGKASLIWEMTPNLSVETEVGVNAAAGIGVNWRWDY
jgi:translocation and assembly module TamB